MQKKKILNFRKRFTQSYGIPEIRRKSCLKNKVPADPTKHRLQYEILWKNIFPDKDNFFDKLIIKNFQNELLYK